MRNKPWAGLNPERQQNMKRQRNAIKTAECGKATKPRLFQKDDNINGSRNNKNSCSSSYLYIIKALWFTKV